MSEIVTASESKFVTAHGIINTIKDITRTTIKEIYPHYYPMGAVKFFLDHHRDENIIADIKNKSVYLCSDGGGNYVGTVTIKKNEICRLFVLPSYHGYGYGKRLIEFAETEISKMYSEIVLDASFSAKSIYLKRGYVEFGYEVIETENKDFL